MSDEDDVDQQIEQLLERIQDLRKRGFHRSAVNVSRELKRLAKREKRVIPYLHANFYIMNDSQSLYDTELGVETAIESIALLESEEQARLLQPDLPLDEYAHTVSWMSACAYDNLAKHIAERDGYNSDGVHDCINDGLQICRRTGKLECITCFREYATSVFRAADDLDMALHHARQVASHEPGDSGNDRRWSGLDDTARLLLLNGQLEAAHAAAMQALELHDTYHDPLTSQKKALFLLETILRLSGRPEEVAPLRSKYAGDQAPAEIPEGEDAGIEFQGALVQALAACCAADHAAAIAILTHWDRWLKDHRAVDNWFEARLRLIAAHKLAGNETQVQALAKQLESSARESRDWLTLRRLKGLVDGTVKLSPLAALNSLTTGPFGSVSPTSAGSQPASLEAPAATDAAATPQRDGDTAPQEDDEDHSFEETPLGQFFEEFMGKLYAEDGDEDRFAKLCDEILAINPREVSHPRDAALLIHWASVLSPATDRALAAWQWAQPFLAPYGQHAVVLSMLANFANTARGANEDDPDSVATTERIEQMFRESLDLDPTHAGNFARAGMYYLEEGKQGDAERCLARGFRLDRSNAQIALRLAEIYSSTERPRDALNVLDLCLREGNADPAVLWEAGLAALAVESYEAMLTYFGRFDEVEPGQAWVHYYRALALLETNRPDDALAALDLEAAANPACTLHVDVLRACAAGVLCDLDDVRRNVGQVLKTPLASVDSLTETGLARLFERLWKTLDDAPELSAEQTAVETLLLQAGLAPNVFFDKVREQNESVEGVNFYICRINQPLDKEWAKFPGCLAPQTSWTGYGTVWGVLAPDSDTAGELVLEWQARCYPNPAVLEEVAVQGEDYTDSPGVVWQGLHLPLDAES